MPGVARILSIDGGGIRGIIPGLILEYIEDRTQKSISELFHMVAGTSTGGILACTLTAPILEGKPRKCSEIVDLYRKRGKEIFSRSFWKGFGSLGTASVICHFRRCRRCGSLPNESGVCQSGLFSISNRSEQ